MCVWRSRMSGYVTQGARSRTLGSRLATPTPPTSRVPIGVLAARAPLKLVLSCRMKTPTQSRDSARSDYRLATIDRCSRDLAGRLVRLLPQRSAIAARKEADNVQTHFSNLGSRRTYRSPRLRLERREPCDRGQRGQRWYCRWRGRHSGRRHRTWRHRRNEQRGRRARRHSSHWRFRWTGGREQLRRSSWSGRQRRIDGSPSGPGGRPRH